MFLSADELKLAYGVDMRIGKGYVDRPVPEGNAYWTGRKLYMPPMTGFLFMPIFSDICRRCGIPLSSLLSEDYFRLAEAILDSAARLEAGSLHWPGHVEECLALAGPTCHNPGMLEDLTHYLRGDAAQASIPLGARYPSLNRADTYLVSLCSISFDRSVRLQVTEAWYALMTYFLLLDDLADIREDIQEQQENTLLDAGLTEQGVQGIGLLMKDSLSVMERVNPVMSNRMDHKFSTIDVRAILRKIEAGEG
jgi:hypothetical protein